LYRLTTAVRTVDSTTGDTLKLPFLSPYLGTAAFQTRNSSGRENEVVVEVPVRARLSCSIKYRVIVFGRSLLCTVFL
jgi:hypothetical protein